MSSRILVADALSGLRQLEPETAQCCVTSPPYWGLRSYLPDDHPAKPLELGLERTPEEYAGRLVDVFREVRRVLRKDGTLWLVLGDSFNAYNGNRGYARGVNKNAHEIMPALPSGYGLTCTALKPKDLIGIPWLVAFALRADGWWLRRDIIWFKPNGMPESTKDRPTSSHEYVFILSRSARYFYDAAAIAEPLASGPSDLRKMQEGRERLGGRLDPSPLNAANPGTRIGRLRGVGGQARARSGNKQRDIPAAEDGRGIPNDHRGRGIPWEDSGAGRNARSVWTIATQPYKGKHFAVMPARLARRCILAGSRTGSLVLDPFAGAGTTGLAARRLGREFVGVEINEKYAEQARRRIEGDAPLFETVNLTGGDPS